MPVGRRPPCVHLPGHARRVRLRSARVDRDDEIGAADHHGRLANQFGIRNSGGHDRDLVRTRIQQVADVLQRAHAAAHGEWHEHGLRGARDHVEQDAPLLVAGRDVEERDLVGLLLVVAARHLDRVARIDVIDVLHALHDAAAVDVETRDDALAQHHRPARRRSAEARSIAPV